MPGRPTPHDVTTLAHGVDHRVPRQRTIHTSGGQVAPPSAENNSGTLASVAWTYNGLGQVTNTAEGHLTGGSGSVTYAYSFNPSGTDNHSRPTTMTYTFGKVVTYDYGTSTALNSRISRVEALKEGTTTLEGYSYLGLNTIVERNRPEPATKLTYIAQGSGDQPAEAGDQYRGLDRFGRVLDQRWRKGSTDFDRFVYAYDEASNRTSRDVLGSSNPGNLDEAYTYDALDRLTKVNRGSLASGTITDANAVYAQTWGLDAVGNWSTHITDSNGGTAGGHTTQTRGHDRRNRITSISTATTPTYDNNGNMTGDEQGRVFKYDAWDRPLLLQTFLDLTPCSRRRR